VAIDPLVPQNRTRIGVSLLATKASPLVRGDYRRLSAFDQCRDNKGAGVVLPPAIESVLPAETILVIFMMKIRATGLFIDPVA
jgi:hypothetical protein